MYITSVSVVRRMKRAALTLESTSHAPAMLAFGKSERKIPHGTRHKDRQRRSQALREDHSLRDSRINCSTLCSQLSDLFWTKCFSEKYQHIYKMGTISTITRQDVYASITENDMIGCVAVQMLPQRRVLEGGSNHICVVHL